MKLRLQANVLIYSMIIVNISLIMAFIVLSNTFVLESNFHINTINRELSENLVGKSNLTIKYVNFLNNNGSGFVDNMQCPTSVTMSGNTLTSTTTPVLTFTGSEVLPSNLYCLGNHLGSEYKIIFNSDFSDFISAELVAASENLSAGSPRTATFSDGDSTSISFTTASYTGSDGYDDNFDSDNYHYNSTGSIDYPNGYMDDDDLARKTIYGYISPNVGLKNVFWNTTKIENYIANVVNNSGTVNSLLGTGSGYLKLNINKDFNMKLFTFDKTSYNQTTELILLDTGESVTQSGSIGYIQSDLTLSGSTTGAYVFDFANKDYALFIENTDLSGVSLYQLTGESLSGSGMYINAINDDGAILKSYTNSMIIDDDGKYIGKHLEIIGKKE